MCACPDCYKYAFDETSNKQKHKAKMKKEEKQNKTRIQLQAKSIECITQNK